MKAKLCYVSSFCMLQFTLPIWFHGICHTFISFSSSNNKIKKHELNSFHLCWISVCVFMCMWYEFKCANVKMCIKYFLNIYSKYR